MFTCIIAVVTYKKDEGREYDLICFNLIRYTLSIMITMLTKMMMILVTIRMIMIRG